MNSQRLQYLIDFVINSHENQRGNSNTRHHDKKTPYAIHPIWCAMTILTETNLDEKLRFEGAEALLLHDILEDTDVLLPECSDIVRSLVKELTFESSAESDKLIFERSDEAKLLKLYDKVSNFLDGSWMSEEKRIHSLEVINNLVFIVRDKFGELNIVRIARSLR